MMEYATKITALYSRLSVGDEDRDGGESNSIVNQKAFLEWYTEQKRSYKQQPKTKYQLIRKEVSEVQEIFFCASKRRIK